MSVLVRGLVLVCVLGLPVVASANGLRSRATQTSSYYYYPTYYYYPSYPVSYVEPPTAFVPAPACLPQVTVAPRNLAQPRPAGPSGAAVMPKTTEPPRSPGVNESRPGVTESRSYFSAYAVATRGAEPPMADRCKVGFWNLSDGDLKLTVGDHIYDLPRGKSVRLDLAREFTWRVAGREVVNEKIANNDAALEIVIRR